MNFNPLGRFATQRVFTEDIERDMKADSLVEKMAKYDNLLKSVALLSPDDQRKTYDERDQLLQKEEKLIDSIKKFAALSEAFYTPKHYRMPRLVPKSYLGLKELAETGKVSDALVKKVLTFDEVDQRMIIRSYGIVLRNPEFDRIAAFNIRNENIEHISFDFRGQGYLDPSCCDSIFNTIKWSHIRHFDVNLGECPSLNQQWMIEFLTKLWRRQPPIETFALGISKNDWVDTELVEKIFLDVFSNPGLIRSFELDISKCKKLGSDLFVEVGASLMHQGFIDKKDCHLHTFGLRFEADKLDQREIKADCFELFLAGLAEFSKEVKTVQINFLNKRFHGDCRALLHDFIVRHCASGAGYEFYL